MQAGFASLGIAPRCARGALSGGGGFGVSLAYRRGPEKAQPVGRVPAALV